MNMAFTKEKMISWIVLFYNNDIIKDNAMSKKEARTFFYQVRKDRANEFSDLLAILSKASIIIRHKHKNPVIHFDAQQLNNILRQHIETRNKNFKPVKKQQFYKCKICSVEFSQQQDLERHETLDRQHYFRNLYFSNSKHLKIQSSDILIEINKGFGSEREVLVLNCSSATPAHIHVKNQSKDIYILTDIIELHQNAKDIYINKSQLPILLKPNTESKLDIFSFSKEVTPKLFVHVFMFVNQTRVKRLDLVKEITLQYLHISGATCSDLLPSKYVKSIAVQNDINPRISVRVKAPMPQNNNMVKLEFYEVPKTLRKLLASGLKPFQGMTKSEEAYLSTIKALVNENDSGLRLTRNNYFHLLDLLLHMEEYQLSVDIRNYDTVTKGLVKVSGYSNRYQLSVPDLAERRPSLLQGDSVYVKSTNSKTYQGLVRLINQDSVILEFNRKFSNEVYTEGINLSVTYGYNRSIIRCEHRSINLLSQHRVLAPFFPTKITTPLKNYNPNWFNPKIKTNPQQQQAVLHILSRTSYPSPYLIFGPPGTGKTMTIVEAISQVWKLKPTVNILVCSPSNSIANEIALRLTPYIPKAELFRYMSVSFGMYDIPDEVLPFTNYDEGDFYQPTLTEICSYRIVISTLSNASRLVSLGVPAKHFSYIFIDESGHATETETLIPIAGLITSKDNAGTLLGQVVLAGDPKQLGPIVHSPYAKEYGYGTSMLERLMTTIDIYRKDKSGKYNPMALTKLILNYRSHPAILHLPNKLFYENELVPKGDEKEINIALNWNMLPNRNMPITFHSVIGLDQREQHSPSYFNIQEIQLVIKYLNDLIGNRLMGRKITQKDIGVIAPYRKQVQKIRKACEKHNWNELTIGSVEQFQGQERLIIIVSTVRSQPKLLKFDNKFHLGFLNNPKRFNVAVTRAKALLIVIGNPNLLQHETYWRIFIQYCIDNNCMTGTHFQFSHQAVDSLALGMAKLRIDGEPDDSVDFSRGNV